MKLLKKNWALLAILLLWFLFSSPYFLQGKIPFPSSYLASNFSPWNTYLSDNVGYVKNSAGPDVITQIFPWKKLVVDSWKSGNIPFWNPYSFAGTPLLANYQSAALSPFTILFLVIPFVEAWSMQILLQPLLAGIIMYFYARSLKIGKEGSVLSSFAFMFCGFITSWMMYGTLGYAVLFIPLSLFAIEKYYDSKKWGFLIVLALSIPLSFFSGHFQMSIYFLLFVLAYSLFKYISIKNVKLFLLTLFFVIAGILISMPQLVPSIEFYFEAARSSFFLKTEVIPWTYLPTFIAPDFFGNPVTRNAWFGHYQEWNAYIGLFPLIFGFYSLFKRNRYIIFFSLSAVISILLAFQTPLLDLLINLKIPVLSTSAASRIIIVFSFSMALLAGFGVDQFTSDLKGRKLNNIKLLFSVVLILFISIWGVLLLKLIVPVEQIAISISNFRLPTMMLGILILAVVITVFLKHKIIFTLFFVVVIATTAFDVYRFSSKWQPFDLREYVYPEVKLGNFLNSLSGYSRAFGSFTQEAGMVYKVPQSEGYDPLFIERYGEFIESVREGKPENAQRNVVSLSKNGKYTDKILDFLGVKYIIHKLGDGRAVWAYPFWSTPENFKTIFQDEKYQVLENLNSFPRAYLVGEYEIIKGKEKIFEEIFSDKFSFKSKVVFEEDPFKKKGDNLATGSAMIKYYSNNKIEIEAKTRGKSILLLTDPYYPGWKAYVDNVPAEIIRANYAFRSVIIPESDNDIRKITFTYSPTSFTIGLLLAIFGVFGSGLMALLLWKTKSRFL